MSLVTVAWLFGAVWVTATSGAPLTQFAKALGASNFQFGLLSALPFIASLLSMPASLLIDRTGARKKIFLWGLYAQRLLWFPIALVPVAMMRGWGAGAAPAAMTLLLWMMFFMHAGNAIGGTAWVSWMADLVPDRMRGKYFGRRRQWGIVAAIPAAYIAGWVIDRTSAANAYASTMTTLGWCAVVFCCAAVFGVIDIAMFQVVPEIPAKPKPHVPLRTMLTGPLKNRQFVWFGAFVAVLNFAVSFMGQFVTLYLIEKLHVTNTATQLMLLVGPMLAQLAMLPVWGRAVDRMGKKPVLAISALGLVPVGFGWCFMNVSGGGWWAVGLGYVLAAAGAGLWAGVDVANFNLVLEFSGGAGNREETGSSYVAVNSVIINIAGCLGGLGAGLIAKWLSDWHWNPRWLGLGEVTFYEVLFALSGVLRLLAVVLFLPKIEEPHARPTREALRFMTANIYNNVFNAISVPLRVVGMRPRPLQIFRQDRASSLTSVQVAESA
jgi:MFS family permease